MKKRIDYLILGGGLSGIYCANRLLKEKGIKNFLILEAKNRIGGRIQTYRGLRNGNYADLGAQWILPEHIKVQELFPTYSTGDSIYELKGKIQKEEQISDDEQFSEVQDKFIQTFLTFLKQNNYTDKNIPKITLEDYLNQFLEQNQKIKDKNDKDLLKQHIKANLESVTAYPIQNISLNYAIFMEQQGKDFSSLEGEFDQMRVENGAENIISKLATDIDAEKYIQLNSKVIEISQNSHEQIEVKVQCQPNKNDHISETQNSKTEILEMSYIAKNLIITIPPFIFKNIKLNLLNENKFTKLQNLIQRYQVGNVVKTFVVYDTPFWRKDNLSGNVFCAENPFISDMYDMSCRGSPNGIIQLFSVGSKAKLAQSLTKEQFQIKVIDTLVQFFGKEAQNYFQFYSHSFLNDPYVLGGYSGIQPLDSFWGDEPLIFEFSKFNKIQNQNIFFIGTETSSEYNGYLEGALRSVDQLFNHITLK